MKTLSGQLRAPWQVRLEEVELPDDPPAGHVLMRVEACGICGSDLTGAVKRDQWRPFGHEIAGIVERVAPDVTNVHPEQRVVMESSSFCGVCELCRNGRVDLCNKVPAFRQQPAMGFSRHMIAPARTLVPYEGLTPDVACLAEPAGVAYDMMQTARVQLGERVAVVGPGPIGLMAAAFAMRGGASSVTVIGRAHSRARLEVARQIGAEVFTCDRPLAEEPELAARFEHVLVTAPAQTLPDCMSLMSYGGEMTYIGFGVGDGMITFDANDFHRRKLQLRGSFASPAIYFPYVLRLLRAGVVPPSLISHRFPLEQLQEAMLTCRDDKAGTVKVVVMP